MTIHRLVNIGCLAAVVLARAGQSHADDPGKLPSPPSEFGDLTVADALNGFVPGVTTAAQAKDAAAEGSAASQAAGTPAPPATETPAGGKGDGVQTDPPSEEPDSSLLLADEAWLNDPFSVLEGEMQETVGYLDKGKTNPPAKVLQPLIVDRLDIMIQMLERSCNGGNGGGQNPSRPANASTLRSGADRRGEMRAAKKDGRKWAELTEKERQKILQSKTDGFPAGYDDILADYFRKLSRTEPAAGDKPAEESGNK